MPVRKSYDRQKPRRADATLTPEHRAPPGERRRVYAVPPGDGVEVGARFDRGDELFPKGARASVHARNSPRTRPGR